MGITAAQVNELRLKTGAGMMDCKKALTETNGDVDGAIELLRKKGQKVSELRAGKEANEGLVVAKTSEDGTKGIVIRVSSETDFVAKNTDFIAFANSVADIAINNFPESLDDLLALELNGSPISELVTELVGKINENIKLSAYEKLNGEGVVAYNHMGNRIGVLIAVNKSAVNGVSQVAKDAAMQVAAMNPVALNSDSVPQEVKDKEFKIGREQAIEEGKPEKIVDKIAEGRLNKFFKENTLMSQQFVKDSSKTVDGALKAVDPELDILGFKRIALGN